MKTIIAGSRSFERHANLPRLIADAVECSDFEVTEVVSGCARGIDTAGEAWAAAHGIPIRRFPADWGRHGRAAGPMRNAEMARYAQALIVIWDGVSRGTKNMIETAKREGLPVHVATMPEERGAP